MLKGLPHRDEVVAAVPRETMEWLLAEDDPAVAVLTRRGLLGEQDTQRTAALWARRNEYGPVRAILDAQREDGSWLPPARDYKKYEGSLWQVLFLGEMWADGADERVRRATEYAFSRQLPDGSWSCNGQPREAVDCLTANVARSLARFGCAGDERVVRALGWIAGRYRDNGYIGCPIGVQHTLNGYCHMLAPKVLLLLAEVPREDWPGGAEELREACVGALREREVYRCLPRQSRDFQQVIWEAKAPERAAVRERFLATHAPLEWGDKPGWTRFGFPLSYNSDALEALLALAAVGEPAAGEHAAALDLVRSQADAGMRWKMRNTHNGKMLADVESKGAPSKWLTLRALSVLAWGGGTGS